MRKVMAMRGEPRSGGEPSGVIVRRMTTSSTRACYCRSHSRSRASAAALSPPAVNPFRPKTRRAPASSTSVTRFSSPGSKRTAVPAGTLSRIPKACARSKRSARLTSKKWKCEPIWIGRSPVLVTVRSTVRRPWFAMMSPSPSRYSPGITVGLLANRMVNGDKLGAVGKGALDLHLLEHLRHSLHHAVAAEDVEACRHQVGDAPAVSNPLENLGGDQRQRFGIVELETPT